MADQSTKIMAAIIQSRAAKLLAMRRKRIAVFSGYNIFSDPAWDILLTLKSLESRAVDLKTTSVGAVAGCPSTTAQRWLISLEKQGLVQRRVSEADARVVTVKLTDQGCALVDEALDIFFERDAD